MIPVYQQDIFNFYKADWTVVQRNSGEFSRYPRRSDAQAEKRNYPAQKFDSDQDDSRPSLATVFTGSDGALQKSEADPRLSEFLKEKAGIPDRVTFFFFFFCFFFLNFTLT